MPASTLPAAKLAIVNLLKAATWPPNAAGLPVAVDYGDPGVNHIEREHVFLGDTGQDGHSWAPYGSLKKEEEYTVKFYVHVANPGATQQEATERAFALFGVVESTLRAQARTASTTIATGVWSVIVSPDSLAEYNTDQGCAAFIDAHIDIKARI